MNIPLAGERLRPLGHISADANSSVSPRFTRPKAPESAARAICADSPQAAEQRKNTLGHVAKIWQTHRARHSKERSLT